MSDATTLLAIVLFPATYFEYHLYLVCQEILVGSSLDRAGKDSLGLNFYLIKFLSS